MRILNISLDRNVFLPETKSRRRVEEYSALFERFDLIVLTKRGYQRTENRNMLLEPTNSCCKLFYIFQACRLGKKMAIKHNYDVVSSQDPFELGWVAWRLARRFGAKFQVQIHGDFFGSLYWRRESFFNRLRYWVGKFIVRRADSVRVVSERIKKSLIDLGISPEKIKVIPIYSQVSLHQKRDEEFREKFIFLSVSRLAAVKNIGMQIEAFKKISEEFPQIELWIVGDGEEKSKLEAQSEKLKLSEKIKFLGWHENTDKFYGEADVFLLTSNYEGWGVAVIEASSFGLPVIMTNVGCAGEVIKNGESGIVIEVGDKRALIEAMKKMVKDKSFLQKIGEGSKKAAMALPQKEESLGLYKKSF